MSTIFFLFSLLIPSFAQTAKNGIELCDEMFSFLKTNHLNPERQNLLAPGENDFPYNIILKNALSEEEDRLVIIFPMEDAFIHKASILQAYSSLQNENINSLLILSYGESQKLSRPGTIFGSSVIAQNLTDGHNNYVLNLDLDSDETGVITGSMGNTSPFWMVKSSFKAFTEGKLSKNLPVYLSSQSTKFSFIKSRALNIFLSNNIQAISLNFDKTVSENSIQTVLDTFIKEYAKLDQKENDLNYTTFRIFSKKLWLSESTIIKIILLTIFISLLFVSFIGFINKNLQNEVWLGFKKNWYKLLIIIAISEAGFFIGLGIHNLITRVFKHQITTAYGTLLLEFSISTILLSIYFMFESIRKKEFFSQKSVDFLILISSFINQFIICLIDISLFPIFFLSFITAVLSFIFKKNWSHIILLFLMIFPFIYYIFSLYDASDALSLGIIIGRSYLLPLLCPLLLLPPFLMFFRILMAIKAKLKKKKAFPIIIYSYFGMIILIFFIFNMTFFRIKTDRNYFNIPDLKDDQAITIEYRDQKVFEDTIKKITIETANAPLLIDISIESQAGNPVLYSDNDYSVLSKNTVRFNIPSNPPQKIILSYGTSNPEGTLKVKAWFASEAKENEYYSVTKEILMGGSK